MDSTLTNLPLGYVCATLLRALSRRYCPDVLLATITPAPHLLPAVPLLRQRSCARLCCAPWRGITAQTPWCPPARTHCLRSAYCTCCRRRVGARAHSASSRRGCVLLCCARQRHSCRPAGSLSSFLCTWPFFWRKPLSILHLLMAYFSGRGACIRPNERGSMVREQ